MREQEKLHVSSFDERDDSASENVIEAYLFLHTCISTHLEVWNYYKFDCVICLLKHPSIGVANLVRYEVGNQLA